MDLRKFDQAFLPFEAKLRAQEELRRRIGVREVDRPTYEKYIIGRIERFDHRRNGFMASIPGNPFGEEMRQRLKARGIEGGISLLLPPLPRTGAGGPHWLLSERRRAEALPGISSPTSAPRLPGRGGAEVSDRRQMSRLIRGWLFFGAEMVRITRG